MIKKNDRREKKSPKKAVVRDVPDPKYRLKDIAFMYDIDGYKLREFTNRVKVGQQTMVTESEFKKLYKKRYGITL